MGVLGCDGIAKIGTPTGLVEVRMTRHCDNDDNENNDNNNNEFFLSSETTVMTQKNSGIQKITRLSRIGSYGDRNTSGKCCRNLGHRPETRQISPYQRFRFGTLVPAGDHDF